MAILSESPRGKIVFLRLFRLSHLPPARSAAEIMKESGLPLLVAEYGNEPWLERLPRQLRSGAALLAAFVSLGRQFVNEGQPRVLVSHGLSEQVLAWCFHLFFGIPYIAWVHEIYLDEKLSPMNRLYRALEGVALRATQFVVMPDARRAQRFQKVYRISRPVFVVPNAPRLRSQGPEVDLRARHGIPREALILLSIGGIAPMNFLEVAIEALRDVPGVVLLMMGWGDTGRLRALARQHGVEDRTVFLGPSSAKWEYLDNSDIAYVVYEPSAIRRLHRSATASNKLM
jgi:glycosyltransferase involved in cell wall biosynthesis